MEKTYWVMKNPSSTTEWIEMSRKQFYEFITSHMSKGRYFMDCDTYKIEISPEQYRKWKIEVNHRNYLKGFEDEILFLPLENIAENARLITELSVNVEDELINNIDLQLLYEAISSMADDEQKLIGKLFMRDKPKTEREVAVLTGLSQQAVNKKKNKILKE